jgi:hypothetical protein
LAPRLPESERGGVLSEALDAALAFGDEVNRSWALAGLAPQLSEALLSEALDAARAIGHEGNRSSVLAALAPGLADILWRHVALLWMETLPVLAARTRPDLLADFRSLTPVLAALAGPNAPTELREVARAISDVARWWP